MESPKSDGNSVEQCAAISPSAQKSPFSKFLNKLSPIKSAGASQYTQRLSESRFPTTLSVFSSPHSDLHRETGFLKREEIAASSSIAHGQCDSLSNSAIIPCIQTQLQSFSPSDCVGEYLADPVEVQVDSAQHAERCVQSATDVALPPSCFTAPDVTIGKANDTNEGITDVAKKHLLSGSLGLVEVSDDQSIDERFDKILEFSSKNKWHQVASNKFLEQHVGQASQQQQGSRRHLQFEATLDCKLGAAFDCHTSRPGIGVPSLIEPKGISMGRQTIFCGQTMAAQASFLGSNSVISIENGRNHATSAQVPSHILQFDNVAAKSPSVGLDVISFKKLAGYQSEEKHIPGRNKKLLEDKNDMEVGDPVDADQKMSEVVLVSDGVHLPDNIEQMACFDQQTLPCDGKMSDQQFADSVEELSQCQDSSNAKRQVDIHLSLKMKRETYTDDGVGGKLCNCKRSKCLKLYCECFAAGVYCVDSCACENCFNNPDYEDTVLDTRQQIELRNPLAFAPAIVKQATDSPNFGDDGNSMISSSARHKRGCKCKRSKCLKKYCECYRAKVGCSDGCRCEDCDNSFGKKSESINQRDEKWKNPSHEKLNTAKVMSDSIKGGTSNQFSPPWNWEELVDVSHLIPLSHPHSRAVPSLTSPNMGDCPNVSQAQSQKGSGLQLSPGQFHWCSSALSPTQASLSKVPHELGSISALSDIMEDGSPDILMEYSNPTNTVKSGSPNQKRVSPPQPQTHELGSNSTPGMQSGRKLILQDVPSFPLSTPYRDSEAHLNQTENDHHGSSHDQ
ncbi:hypothetical protein DITRI_Ditri19aG0126500 [Diplodiscus trichospermus]